MRFLRKAYDVWRPEEAHRHEGRRREPVSMRTGECVESGKFRTSPLDHRLVHKTAHRLWRHNCAIRRNAAPYQVLEKRPKVVPLPRFRHHRIRIAKRNDRLADIAAYLEIADTVHDLAIRQDLRKVGALKYHQVKVADEPVHVQRHGQRRSRAAERLRICADHGVRLDAFDMGAQARKYVFQRLLPPPAPFLNDRIAQLARKPLFLYARKLHKLQTVESKPLLWILDALQMLVKLPLASFAVARLRKSIIEHDSSEPGFCQGDRAYFLKMLHPFIAGDARKPTEIASAASSKIGQLLTVQSDLRPFFKIRELTLHHFGIKCGELHISERVYAMLITVLDETLHVREIPLLNLPAHALVKTAVKPVQAEIFHQSGGLGIKPVHPSFQPLGVTVDSARAVAAHTPVHRVRLMRAERPAGIHRINLNWCRVCGKREE